MNEMKPLRRTAKLFWTGRSQAVRLPKEFRFEGTEVRIRKEGREIVLEPVVEDNRAWADRLSGILDEDFARAVEEGRLGPEHMPDGPNLD